MEYDLRNLNKFDRIGIMGGTFDPIHFGHLAAAEAAREKYGLSVVLFIPSGIPPHKEANSLTDGKHRYNMVRLAIRGNPHFAASRMEIDRDGVSYTIDTLREIRSFMSEKGRLYFIIGADTAALLPSWKEFEVIPELTDFLVLPRHGYDTGSGLPETPLPKNAEILDMPLLEISATDIRERIKNHKSVNYLLPAAVVKYIHTFGLYVLSGQSLPEIMDYLEKNLSKKRYLHTMGVYETASKLSRIYGADEKKTAIAALLHDCAKDMLPAETLKACDKYGVKSQEIFKESVGLAHPIIGAKIAADKFGVRDHEILNAIKYHTTGRKNMTLIEKIIYVADRIEPYREPFTELDRIREIAEINLDQALIIVLKSKIAYVKSQNKRLHPLSVAALRFLQGN